jgi:hypothetical protein
MPTGSRTPRGPRVGRRRPWLNPRWTKLDRILILWVVVCTFAGAGLALLWDWDESWWGPAIATMNVLYVGAGIATGLARDRAPMDRTPRSLIVMRLMLGLYALAGLLALGAVLLFVLFLVNVPWGGIR